MKTTRRGVFETNSSSSHSIAICNTGSLHPDDIPVSDYYDDGVNAHTKCIVLTGGEFGWEVESHHDALTKANYLAIAANTEARKQLLIDVLKEATGASEVVFACQTDEYNGPRYSYIDHQSAPCEGDAAAEAFESADAMKAFIFNRGSTLHTDNDNH
jgi:hypothetical protein